MEVPKVAKPIRTQRLEQALNLDPFLKTLEPNDGSSSSDDTNSTDDDKINFNLSTDSDEEPVDKSKLFNFSQVDTDREWLKKLLLESSDDSSSTEITEEYYFEMLRNHIRAKKYRKKYHTNKNNENYKYYGAGMLSKHDKYSAPHKSASGVKKRKNKKYKNLQKPILKKPKDNDLIKDKFYDDHSSSPNMKFTKIKLDLIAAKCRETWINMCRKEIPKYQRFRANNRKEKLAIYKKTAHLAMKHYRQKVIQSQKIAKETSSRMKHLTREMQSYWKKFNREEKQTKRQMEKEAEEQRKIDLEMIEKKQQLRKLNFLITQTELYAYFISRKIGEDSTKEQLNILNQLNEPDYNNEALKLQAKKNAIDALAIKNHGPGLLDLANLGPIGKEHPQPKLFRGILKGYQLKGMNWIVNLYNKGVNGILADEMGLGKTVQSIAFLCHIAEKYSLWGPFLIITPASTLYNWQQEMERFAPSFKVVPYWGTQNERKILRRFWDQKDVHTKNAHFHIVITSYQIVTSDLKYFNKINWQYMILDEAQAIKSPNSIRWKMFLRFNCRNRLLLTGTPLQNSMAELWALLHFIMPNLFDSHNEFNDWFSKYIENHADNKSDIEKDLSRLHMVLKPFMLRRIKKDVEKELSDKIEIMVYCPLTTRQKLLYMTIKKKIKIDDLLHYGGKGSCSVDRKLTSNLMNLVMQFRKVCNHPDFFERRNPESPLFFECLNYDIPKIVYEYVNTFDKRHILYNLLFIFPCEHITSIEDNSTFNFLYYLNVSPKELYEIMNGNLIFQWQHYFATEKYLQILHHQRFWDNDNKVHALISSEFRLSFAQIQSSSILQDMIFTAVSEQNSVIYTHTHHVYHLIIETIDNYNNCNTIYVERTLKILHCQKTDMPRFLLNFTPKVTCKSKRMYCNSRKAQWDWLKFIQIHSWQGLQSIWDVCSNIDNFREKLTTYMNDVPLIGGIESASPLKSWSNIVFPDKETLVTDSGKLTVLDNLLKRLKTEGHKVLIYSQMTKMMDVLEEYLRLRKHKYIRLDGSSKISDRRDMVVDFQSKPDIFIFLLSTRAGGLGINLTAADTVIFYDSDWNPTLDQQAMDRAHRLGQTKQVTVYRLICKGTIEERILQRAKEKSEIQKMVISRGNFNTLRPKEVVSLLLDDKEIEMKYRQRERDLKRKQIMAKKLKDNNNDPYNVSINKQVGTSHEALVVNLDSNFGSCLPKFAPSLSKEIDINNDNSLSKFAPPYGLTQRPRIVGRGQTNQRSLLRTYLDVERPGTSMLAISSGSATYLDESLESGPSWNAQQFESSGSRSVLRRRRPGRPCSKSGGLSSRGPRGVYRTRRPVQPLQVPIRSSSMQTASNSTQTSSSVTDTTNYCLYGVNP